MKVQIILQHHISKQPILFALLIVAISLYSTPANAQIAWNRDNWAFGCDFMGNDIGSRQIHSSQCGPLCASTQGCTHFSWAKYNGGTCWMKYGPITRNDAFATGDQTRVCGIVVTSSSPQKESQQQPQQGLQLQSQPAQLNFINWNANNWAIGCDFVGNDLFSKQIHSSQCIPLCAATQGCTHFTWSTQNGGMCWLKYGEVSRANAIATSDDTKLCGIVNKQQPMPMPNQQQSQQQSLAALLQQQQLQLGRPGQQLYFNNNPAVPLFNQHPPAPIAQPQPQPQAQPPLMFNNPQQRPLQAAKDPLFTSNLAFSCMTKSIGCFQDTYTVSVSATTNSNEFCVEQCGKLSYLFSATHDECFCSNSFGQNGPSQDCSTPCRGNPNQMCGGQWPSSVWTSSINCPAILNSITANKNTATYKSKLIGCYADQTSSRDLTFTVSQYLSDNKNQNCAAICAFLGYYYSGTQNGNQCYCGNSFGRYGTSNMCNMKCSGNMGDTCGGILANTIYSTIINNNNF